MFSLTAIVSFLVVLGIVVVFHEFGHFIVARWCGVQVETFSLGMGPKILSKKFGTTEYCLSILPLGGYVRMLGDDPSEEIPEDERDRSFLSQPARKKIAIVVAGPIFNLILAMLIYSGIYMIGFPTVTAVLGGVQEESAAESAGLLTGDKILSIDQREITTWDELRETVKGSDGKTLNFTIERDSEQLQLSVTPKKSEGTDVFGDKHVDWLVGITPSGEQTSKSYNPVEAVYLGAENTAKMTYLTIKGIVRMIQGRISADNIGGPILIAQLAGETAKRGIMTTAFFIAMISINLGVLNLLPIPVLDGGHFVFFSIEGILGRPLSLKKREIAQQIGLFLLVSLMVFAFYNDIMRILVKPG